MSERNIFLKIYASAPSSPPPPSSLLLPHLAVVQGDLHAVHPTTPAAVGIPLNLVGAVLKKRNLLVVTLRVQERGRTVRGGVKRESLRNVPREIPCIIVIERLLFWGGRGKEGDTDSRFRSGNDASIWRYSPKKREGLTVKGTRNKRKAPSSSVLPLEAPGGKTKVWLAPGG
jgi:hypothetical protein